MSPGERLTRIAARAPVPAVAVAVFDRDRVLASVVHGIADLTTGRPAAEDCWWDLASLTKVLVTLPEVLDHVPLDRPLETLWPRAAGLPVGRATAADLLSYRAGLPATVPFFKTLSGRDTIVDAALRTPLSAPGPVYSDLGSIILGALVEERTGTPLPELARRRTGLRMGGRFAPAVATERCPWRGRLVVGEVHDENAAAMGGVAGHAGAFGTLALVTAAAQDWLAGRTGSPAAHDCWAAGRTGSPAAHDCWAAGGTGDRYGLGWWLPPTRGLGGPSPGADSYGLSGFVGNRIWLEPSRGYGVVVLSNRVHPARGDRGPFNAWCDTLLTALPRLVG
ncbi:beta-lactamase family protein [Dactylosporangium fulvum]|uniref:Beta-lactamase family protein n=1 Tax=Dactylosporangium fulvum TaxID=53359 RepID=A0ABY5VPS0_9ACTN|nr:serine hydrolase domain-containing protein [Dactylosporangium fulvum]UWP78796.1 beta-lactamase family protein [Dactylosporangium fulvum]